MTLTTLLFRIGIAAIILTLVIGFGLKKQKSWMMTFAQNYCGLLFLFSGWVKAVDPLGTAYKMTDYFGEFHSTFSETMVSFIAPIFPFFATYAESFSVGMIIFEIVLGLMLILGASPKWTGKLFLGLVAFFTVLTGYTYLTGYVPEGVNFFEFGKWGAYKETNMKVTDCGCFGDFIKLVPQTSFLKDVALMIPALYFVFRKQDMHQLISTKVQNIVIGVSTVGLLIYCFSNYIWNIPHADFRPFAIGNDIRTQKAAEAEAQANVQILEWVLKNKDTEEQVNLTNHQYMKEKGYVKYPKKEGWEIIDQVKTEPAIPATKISEYTLEDFDGNDMTDGLLEDSGYSVMVVCYKLYTDDDKMKKESVVFKDTIYQVDTVMIEGQIEPSLVKSIQEIKERTESKEVHLFDPTYLARFTEKTNSFTTAAEKAGWDVYGVAGGAGQNKIEDLRHAAQTAYPFYAADDILLKTIVRSNPGVVVMKDGKIVDKWHYTKLPEFEVFKATLK